MKKYLAFDIGGTFVKYGLVGENANILESHKIKTPSSLRALIDEIGYISDCYQDVEGIAISSPGAVSHEGIIHGSSAIPYIHGPNIKKLFAERTNKAIHMENDANCAALAEVWSGSAIGKKDVLVMVIGTGIGGAIIKDGFIHKGAHLHGGEFGYMLVNADFNDSNDVWSRIASTKALVRKVAAMKKINMDSLSGEKIFEMAESGNPDCMKAINQFYHLLAVGIYNLQYIYDPEIILIGGGISARKDLIERINEKLDSILDKIDLAKIKPNIDTCRYRQNANLLGAVYAFMKSSERDVF